MVNINYAEIEYGRKIRNKVKKAADNNIIHIDPTGLDENAVKASIEKYGKNILTKKKKIGFFRELLNNLNDPIIKILIGALCVSTILNFKNINIPETLGIIAAISIATLVSTISEYSSSLAFEKLSDEAEKSEYFVRRNGEIISVFVSEIVIGDIILLSGGEKVPADGYIISGEITASEAALTGESAEIRKTITAFKHTTHESFELDGNNKSKLFSGSIICSGSCEMVAVKIGDNTLIGRLAADLQDKKRPSPLKNRLTELAKSISFLGYVGAIMIAFAYLFNAFIIDSGMKTQIILEKITDISFVISEVLHAFTVAISVIVVAVPEGLPMMITVVLSSNMKKMLKNGVLVRKLVGIETAGSMNILFTDKTGTLTTGKMTVCSITTFDNEYTSSRELKKIDCLYNRLKSIADYSTGIGNVSATEKAIIEFFLGNQARTKENIEKIPFNSRDKLSYGIKNNKKYILGAPEKILNSCNYYFSNSNIELELDFDEKKELYSKLQALAKRGARVLAMAEEYNNRSVFICFAAIRDPLRSDIKSTVKTAKEAGIHVVMVTGDNLLTASEIAREAGILQGKAALAIDSKELNEMTDEELIEKLPQIAVIARALPTDKIRLVKAAEKARLISGMTGDGINDAPALKAADVGFAMGSGTEIAKEASDIVITDDSFKSITNAVLYGRTIFNSIRKFIVFQLTMNLCAMGVSLIGPFIGIDNPVTVIQMLWVNIIMDTLGGLAFAGEPALKSYLKRKSLPQNEKILSKVMINKILFCGGYSLLLCIFFLKSTFIRSVFAGKSNTYFLTSFFALLIFCGIFNSFNARTDSINILSHIAGNKPFVFIMSLVAFIQLLIIYFGGSIFRCVPLDRNTLIFTAALALTVIPANMLRRLIFKA